MGLSAVSPVFPPCDTVQPWLVWIVWGGFSFGFGQRRAACGHSHTRPVLFDSLGCSCWVCVSRLTSMGSNITWGGEQTCRYTVVVILLPCAVGVGGGQWHQCGDIVYSEGPSRWAASSHCFTAVFVQTGALKHGFPMHNCLPSDVQAHRHRRNRWWQAGASHAEMFCESLTTFCSDLSRGLVQLTCLSRRCVRVRSEQA